MDKNRYLATFITLIIILLIFFLILSIDLINDKNNCILNLTEENQELTDQYEDALQKYIDKKHELEKYQRKYGDINE